MPKKANTRKKSEAPKKAAKAPKRTDHRQVADAAGDDEAPQRPRSFWSGNIAFGLVSVPVSLFVASRSSGTALRMVDADGTPLNRRYFCSREDRPVDSDDIVRGFEVAKDHFVIIEDDELAALAPEKSQEIDLRRFVPLAQIDPMYFERAYLLAPDKGASKAYRLLARIMEDTGRAGIATFVMRGKEYLVAIIAERGLLRAETLRFHDELRTPDDVGLPPLEPGPAQRVERITQAMTELSANDLDRGALANPYSRRLRALAERKLLAGEDVVAAEAGDDALDADDDEPGAEVVDLMAVLKQSLEDEDDDAGGRRAATTRSPARRRAGKERTEGDSDVQAKPRRAPRAAGRKPARQVDLEARPKTELYEVARDLDISGRSAMSRDQLIEAIRARR
jgi:DNA end-binding protein Ku